MAEIGKTKKKSIGSMRAKAGFPAKAGRRRPPHLQSVRDRNGHRDYIMVSHPVPKQVSKKVKAKELHE
jgi:hypothetical protein